jgi:hypothetical protein
MLIFVALLTSGPFHLQVQFDSFSIEFANNYLTCNHGLLFVKMFQMCIHVGTNVLLCKLCIQCLINEIGQASPHSSPLIVTTGELKKNICAV